MAARSGELILLGNSVSMFSMRVKIALAEKGIQYEWKEEDLGNKSPLLLQSNPIYKKVPVLIHNGKPICESLMIVQYIDEVWNNKAPILLSDPYQRSQSRFWADYVEKKMAEVVRKLWMTKGEEQETAKKEFKEILKVLEGQLDDKPFLDGEKFGFADIALIPFYSWFYTYEQLAKFSIEAESPKVVEWGKRCMQRETVSKSLADPIKVYEFALMFRKWFGID